MIPGPRTEQWVDGGATYQGGGAWNQGEGFMTLVGTKLGPYYFWSHPCDILVEKWGRQLGLTGKMEAAVVSSGASRLYLLLRNWMRSHSPQFRLLNGGR